MKSPDIIIHRSFFFFLIGLLLTFPFLSSAQTVSASSNSITINEDNKQRQKFTICQNGTNFSIEYEGYITLSDDDRDVVAISAGGYLKVSKSAFGSKRRVQIEADRSGNMIRKYYVGWSQKDYEPEGRTWLAEILPVVVRSSTLAAEDRVDRIYTSGGITAFAQEVRKLEGDYVKAAYLKLILCKSLQENEVDQVVQLMGTEIESDHYLSELLRDNISVLLKNPARLSAFKVAMTKIDSDHYSNEVFQKINRSSEVSDALLVDLLSGADNIQSDHYLSSVLIDVLRYRDLSNSGLDQLLKVSRSIQSDHYLSEVLKDAIRETNLNSQSFRALTEALRTVESDHYSCEVVKAMSDRELSKEDLSLLLTVMGEEVESDHYLKEALVHVLRKQNASRIPLTSFLKAVGTVGSGTYSMEVMKEIERSTNLSSLSDAQVIEILQACGKIDSDHYLTEALSTFAAEAKPRGGSVKEAYLQVAGNISSETYYGRAAKAVN